MIHQNHPGEGHAGYKRPTPYLCAKEFNEEDGPGISYINAKSVTCPDCLAHPYLAQEEAPQ